MVWAESETTEDKVYVQPIPGLKSGLFGISAKTIIESLIDDNYQVYCAAPTQVIGPEVVGEYKRFLELYFGKVDEKEKPLETVVSDPSSISNPDIWNDEGDGYKGESVVNYQYKNKTDTKTINSNIITDGINRQRSLYEQCINQKATRKDVIGRCQELKDVKLSDCPLNIDIPGMPGIQIADIDIDCNDLLDEDKYDQIEEWKINGMLNTPDASAIKTNMKPAYLMICFEQKNGVGRWFDNTKVEDKKFYTNSIWSWINSNFLEKKGECSVRSIQIPVAVTEQNPKYEDYPLEVQDQSKKFFMSLNDQKAEEKASKKARSARKKLALDELASGFLGEKLIRLRNSDDEFKKALAFIVNGTAPPCTQETVRQEEAKTIGSESTLKEDGIKYKASDADAYHTWSKGGALASLVTKLKTILYTGKRIKDDFEGRVVYVRSYIFAPYSNKDENGAAERISLQQFFLPKIDYEKIRFMAQKYWPTHINFQNFLVSSATNEKCESFEDPESCEWKEYNPPKIETDEWGGSWPVYGEWVCKEKEFCVTGKDLGQQYSTPISYMRGDIRPILSLLPVDDAAWKHANKTLGDPTNTNQKPNIEDFLKGKNNSNNNSSSNNDNGEELACQELKNIKTVLPTKDELRKIVCDIAKNDDNDPTNDAYDAQMLWGFLVLESNLTKSLGDQKKTISCGELIVNDCGASEIAGVLIPQCIDTNPLTSDCPNFEGAVKIANDTTDKWIQEVRENPNIACDVETQLDYILRKRKNSINWIRNMYYQYNNSYPSIEETYLLMSGRNLGFPISSYESIFTKKVCEDTVPASDGSVPEVSKSISGCDGLNYCECTMNHPDYQINCEKIE